MAGYGAQASGYGGQATIYIYIFVYLYAYMWNIKAEVNLKADNMCWELHASSFYFYCVSPVFWLFEGNGAAAAAQNGAATKGNSLHSFDFQKTCSSKWRFYGESLQKAFLCSIKNSFLHCIEVC